MPKRMPREYATQPADLPHRFELDEELLPGLCAVCSAVESDPRHKSWERAKAAGPETKLRREFG